MVQCVSHTVPHCSPRMASTARSLASHAPPTARARRSDTIVCRASKRDRDRARQCWLQTSNVQCVQTAAELALTTTVVCAARDAETFAKSVNCELLVAEDDGSIVDRVQGARRGAFAVIRSPEECARAAAAAASRRDGDVLVMDCVDGWSIIPAENLVAAFAGTPIDRALFACVHDAAEARVMLEALETGVDGVCLRTNDPAEVRALADAMRSFGGESSEKLELVPARVTAVKRVGAGDRCAVDAATNFELGEGMLVGSFASGLFLIHAENIECGYVNTRPFRVNAGPTASYVRAPNGKTSYLSELRCGSEIRVCAADGRTRLANVARVKMERRSMLMIEADHPSGPDVGTLAVLLQNAETCRLVRPGGAHVSVAELVPGDEVLVVCDRVARHTGVAVEEDAWLER